MADLGGSGGRASKKSSLPKRKVRLYSIFKHERNNEHRVFLEDYSRRAEAAERRVLRKQAIHSGAQSDLYQILGLFSVFQGVVLTAVAQSSQLRCHNWLLPFFLSLISYVLALAACWQKLSSIMEFRRDLHIEKENYKALQKTVDEIRDEGTRYRVMEGQPDLESGYMRSVVDHHSFLGSCRAWLWNCNCFIIISMTAFSFLTLFSINRILCHPGDQVGSTAGPPAPAPPP